MSYILEALKKSDKERKEAEASARDPLYVNSRGKAVKTGKKSLLSPFPLLLGTLVFLVIGLFALYLKQDRPPLTTPSPTITENAGTSSPAVETSKPAPPVPEVQPPQPQVQTTQKSTPAPHIENTAPTRIEKPEAPPAITPTPEPAVPVEKLSQQEPPGPAVIVTEKPPKPPTQPQSVHQDIPLLEDLPPDTLANLPLLKFAGHAYSETPEQRMIMINNKILREGDLVGPNLYLNGITESGVIFRYRKTLFRKELF